MNSATPPISRPSCKSWLDSATTGEIFPRSEGCGAVVKSRYHALEHLRQIPADEVLARHEPKAGLNSLLDHRGCRTGRWDALGTASSSLSSFTPFSASLNLILGGMRTSCRAGRRPAGVS
ncbi:hypothetical protein ACFVWY_05765 [Streptomyces sp. NPDC058195]|uniref:hypothetical protein n=1 Tax=Streptomyces sp. NPDC058195 TaxID=3346375 RepID=UPI0036EB0B80